MKYYWHNSILMVLLIANLSSCSDNKSKSSTRNSLNIDIAGDVTTFDPQAMIDAYTFRVLSDMYEGLVDMDQANRPIPGMAEKWTVSPDGKTYIFNLRHDLKFSDGSPLTAHDFVYSWQRLASPKTAGYKFVIDHLSNAESVFAGKLPIDKLGITALDNYTLKVTLASPDPAFIAKCTTIFTSAVPQKIIAQYGESWALPQHVVSTGAYRLTKHIANGTIQMHKNDYFYDVNHVKIDNLNFIPYADRNAALAAYKTGDIDISANVPIDQYQQLKTQYPQELHTVKMEGITFYSLNTRIGKLQNKDLRQALSMVIDRDVLVNKILANGQTALYSYISASIEQKRYGNLNYDWQQLSYPERIKIAQQLYAKAGYNHNHPLELDLLYDNNDASRKVAIAIANMWESGLGVKTNLHSQEWKGYLTARKNGNFEVIRNSWGAAFNFITTYTPEYQCKSSVNVSDYCNNEYDNLITQADKEQNPHLQTKLYQQAIKLAMKEYAVIPLYQNSYTTLIKPYVHGLDIESNLLEDIRSKWISF